MSTATQVYRIAQALHDAERRDPSLRSRPCDDDFDLARRIHKLGHRINVIPRDPFERDRVLAIARLMRVLD